MMYSRTGIQYCSESREQPQLFGVPEDLIFRMPLNGQYKQLIGMFDCFYYTVRCFGRNAQARTQPVDCLVMSGVHVQSERFTGGSQQ